MSFLQEIQKLNPDIVIDLVEIDTTVIDSNSTPLRFTRTAMPNLSSINWDGNSYQYFPIQIDGIEVKADGTALPRPTLTLSNVNRLLIATILSFGDISGALLKTFSTFYKYTDDGTEPDTSQHGPIYEYIIAQQTTQSRKIIQYQLTSVLDRPNAFLPARQILRDRGFPGVSRVRRR